MRLTELSKYVALVAISASIAVMISVSVMDRRYAPLLRQHPDGPYRLSVSVDGIEEAFDGEGPILSYDVAGGFYNAVPSIADIEKSLIVFSDFNCSYCEAAGRIYAEYADQHDLRTIYFIEAAILGSDSERKALYSISQYMNEPSQYDRREHYQSQVPDAFSPNAEERKVFESHTRLVQALRVNATPTLIVRGQFLPASALSLD